MKEQYYILAIVLLISLFITSLGIIRHLTKQRDHFSQLLKYALERENKLSNSIREISDTIREQDRLRAEIRKA